MATLTLTYPDALDPTLQRALAQHGPNVVADLVVTWLRDRERVFEDADLVAARGGTADAATKARLRARLGL